MVALGASETNGQQPRMKYQRSALLLVAGLALLFAACSGSLPLSQPSASSSSSAEVLQPVAASRLQHALDDARIRSGTPGVSAAIIKDGKTLWLGGSGFADIKTRKRISANTLYPLASTTKMFVATTVLRLWELGRLGLDDPIRRYVPAYMPSTDRVRIRNLLGHTSGYRDVEYDPTIIKWLDDPNHIWRREQILIRVKPVHFPPGSRFEYCNTNYVILGGIVERAAGASIGKTFDRLIIDPLHLTNDAVFPRLPWAGPHIAHGYDSRGKLTDTFEGARLLGVPTGDWGVMWTDGGLAADARGVARFTDALFGGHILHPKTLATMLAPGPNGSYGLGTFHMRFDRHKWQGHDGFYYGFTTVAMYDLRRHVTIVVLTNLTDSADPAYTIWYALTRAYDRLAS